MRVGVVVMVVHAPVRRLARIIIQERPVPTEAKSIKPVDAGGVAGGVKFLVGSIFFK